MGKIPDELRKTIAKNIRESRMRKYPGRGGSKKCAEEFGVSPQQWSPWERGRRTPDETRLTRIAEHLGVTVEFLRRDNAKQRMEQPLSEGELLGGHGESVVYAGERMVPSCPFYHPPTPGQPWNGEAKSLCWLVERILNEVRDGIPIRLSREDMNYLLERILQPTAGE
jgi:transcriptional regulator with XRE-family HTH domain